MSSHRKEVYKEDIYQSETEFIKQSKLDGEGERTVEGQEATAHTPPGYHRDLTLM